MDVMVDSGNTTAATAAISLACATRLGLSWEATAPRKIATASTEGAGLTVRGEIQNLCLRLEGGAEPLILQNAWIVDPLGGDVNLGIRFLEQHNVVLDWTRQRENRPVMKLPGHGNEIICTMATPAGEPAEPTGDLDVPVLEMAEVITDLKLKIPKNFVVGPCQGRRVQLRLEDVPAEADGLYVPGGGTCELLVVEGLYCVKQNPSKEALVEIMLLNTTEDAITVDTKRLEGQAISLCRRAGMHMPRARLPATTTAATVSAPGKIDSMMTSDRTEEIIKELQLQDKA